MINFQTIRERFKLVFSIDLRSLAVFRMSLGIVILLDLFIRSTDIRAFYTNDGVMPQALWPLATNYLHWSFHVASGELWYQILLFSLAGLFACCLIVGYRTRLMCFLSWIFLVSLLNRNHFILQAGDMLLVILAFWSMFLPLNARMSVDSALSLANAKDPNLTKGGFRHYEHNQYFSIATIAVLLQVLYLYFFTALLKYGTPWRVTFDAAFYAVSLEQFATPIGEFVRNFPLFLKASTAFVLALEFVALFTALSPIYHVPLRIITLTLLFLLHASFLAMLHIGLFPLIDFVALTLLIPAAIWHWLGRHRRQSDIAQIKMFYDEDCGFCKKTCLLLREFFLPRTVKILPAQSDPVAGPILEKENSWVVTDAKGKTRTHWNAVQFVMSKRVWSKPFAWVMNIPFLMNLGNKLYKKIGDSRDLLGNITERFLPYRPLQLKANVMTQLLAAFFLYVVTTVNLAGVKDLGLRRPHHVTIAEKTTRIDQRWGMFAPHPLTYSIYPVVPGVLRDGTFVDLFRGIEGSPKWNAPEMGYEAYPGYRWRKLFERVNGGAGHVRKAYGDYLCRNWNSKPGRKREHQLTTLSVHVLRRRTNTEGLPKKESKHKLWSHWCFSEFKPKPKPNPKPNPTTIKPSPKKKSPDVKPKAAAPKKSGVQ